LPLIDNLNAPNRQANLKISAHNGRTVFWAVVAAAVGRNVHAAGEPFFGDIL
jgi:hypothetical protein